MKKVFVLIALIFAVVCYAAPPPDVPKIFFIEDVGFFQSQELETNFTFDAQEVAFACIGNKCNLIQSNDLNSSEVNYGSSDRLCSWQANKQDSNYGYPFGADFRLVS
jgi:hypothetical protein